MIKAKCHTNIDAFKRCDWPTIFCIAPTVGQRVEEVGDNCSLKVCQITHCEQEYEVTPYLKIELTGQV